MAERRRHPLAWRAMSGNGFDLGRGRFTGDDRIICTLNGKHGYMDEAMHDGDALVSYDDGTFDIVKWGHLRKEKPCSRRQQNGLAACKDSLHTHDGVEISPKHSNHKGSRAKVGSEEITSIRPVSTQATSTR
jgi:hypothetical protein